ncbi:MAG: UvrD-helicase domain-containing protein [Pirellulales bacterium]|nr:UvrD-helicase domain-containing protein [Pirellulales bacterium]
MHPLLEGLTDAQREAVDHVEGPLLILAGPGSGKTRVITHRVAWLLHQGVPAHQILALTFTNKAADEMRSRVERLADEQSVWLSTFHRFCARLLRKYAPAVGLQENYTIYDTGDSSQTLRRVIGRLRIEAAGFTPDTMAKAISWAKNNLITPSQYEPRPGHPFGAVVQRVYPAYQAQLLACNAVDFDDLLLHVATLLRDNPEIRQSLDERYRFVLVDEYQDTNLAQYAIARALSIDHPNLAVTGDPDQSIYGWRGANLNNILEFERDFPEVRVVRLERNYRSTKRILRVASQLIAHNIRRKEKNLYTENGEGQPVRLIRYSTHKDEAEGIAARIAADVHSGRRRPRDFAVFYRVNALSRALEFALRDLGLPYQMVNGLEFFQRREIKDVLAYLQLLNNPHDEIALLRVINTPNRGIGKTTIERLSAYGSRHGLTLLESARRARQVESLSGRSISLVGKFVALFDRLASVAGGPIEEVLGFVLSETGYQERLKASKEEEDLQRLANIEELLTVAREYDERHLGEGRLEEFLEESCLVNDTDDWEVDVDRVTLMTLHASKGLEFPVVYLVAVEEGLLPHERSRQIAEQLEEERRLMFVGVTRAQEELQISLAEYRDFRGQRKMTVPSPFLMELPREEMALQDVYLGESLPAESVYETPRAPRREPPAAARAALSAPLTTAAELANGGEPAAAVAPDAFHQDMLVRHPQYGLGRIVALSGAGAGRKATVDFTSTAGRKKFVLAESPVRPVKP